MLASKEGFSFAGRAGDAIGGVFPLTIVPYHYMALRRVFGGTRWQVAWKGTLIVLLYSAIILSIMFALLMITMKGAGPSATPKALHLP